MADWPFFFEYRNYNNNITPLLAQRKSSVENMTQSRVILQYYFQDLSLAQGKFSNKNVGEVPMTGFQLILLENIYSRKN